jgi:hypothetical protein
MVVLATSNWMTFERPVLFCLLLVLGVAGPSRIAPRAPARPAAGDLARR